MNRTRLIIMVCVAALGIGVLVWGNYFNGPSSEDCEPVVALLDFNHQQTELISSKSTEGSGALPTVAEDSVYQQWADGLAQRAQEVSDPELGQQAVRLADLAAQFVTKLPGLRSVTQAQAPGAPAPQLAYDMDALNGQITDQLAELAKACPR
jgi:hypothetical protein